MSKKLLKYDFVVSRRALATSQNTLSTFTDQEIRKLCAFEPPQTYELWLAATDVRGKIYGTKSRGDRLQAVDRAYRAWIGYAGAEGITHAHNAENLKDALQKYFGTMLGLGGQQPSGLSTNYRAERNKGGVIADLLRLTTLIHALSNDTFSSKDEERRLTRKMMLTLIANIGVEWDWKTALLKDGASVIMAGNDVVGEAGKKMASHIMMAVEGGVAVVGGSAVAISERDTLGAKIKKFLKEQAEKFLAWLRKTWEDLKVGDIRDLMVDAAKAVAVVVQHACEAVASFVSGGADILEGLKDLISDAWVRSALSVQRAHLVTSEGSFALIRGGIESGIKNRQAVAGWKIIKGTTTIVVAATSAGLAGKIADLVLGGFEFIFKMLYNRNEINSIGKLISEAKILWSTMHNGANSPGASPGPGIGGSPELVIGDVAIGAGRGRSGAVSGSRPIVGSPPSPGTMPPFKAAHYTPEQFLADKNGAYLNFIHSMVKASPVMAAIVMNSGVISTVDDVLHAATPRSTDDVGRAQEHIASLKIEAVRLFVDSGYTVTPVKIAVLSSENNVHYQRLLNNAKLATQPELVVS